MLYRVIQTQLLQEPVFAQCAPAETFITAVTAIGQSTSQVEPVIPGEVEVHEIFAFDKQVLDNLAHQTYSRYFYIDTFRPPAYWIVQFKLRKYPALKSRTSRTARGWWPVLAPAGSWRAQIAWS